MEQKWHEFYLNTNQWWGWIRSQEDWQELLEKLVERRVYDHADEARSRLKQAKSTQGSGEESGYEFGLYEEHRHEPRLGEWARSKGMDL